MREYRPGFRVQTSMGVKAMSNRLAATLLILVLAGCSGPGGRPQPRDMNVVTSEELAATHVINLYDAIAQIRPHFLRDRGYISISTPVKAVPVVYVDNMFMGQLEFLRSMSTGDVAEVRRISAEEATTRWGTGHPGGVIFVTTHAAQRPASQ